MFDAAAHAMMDSLIGPGTRIDGNLQFCGGMRIDGRVCGNVTGDRSQVSYLVISEHGSVEGEVRCDHLVVNGHISGMVYTTELLEIQPKARIIGDVYYKVLEMHGGAQVLGQLTHEVRSDPSLHLEGSQA
jgi:cytoskeletal protein CcmA (bactofilin family)